jgi:hypothetical protein
LELLNIVKIGFPWWLTLWPRFIFHWTIIAWATFLFMLGTMGQDVN